MAKTFIGVYMRSVLTAELSWQYLNSMFGVKPVMAIHQLRFFNAIIRSQDLIVFLLWAMITFVIFRRAKFLFTVDSSCSSK